MAFGNPLGYILSLSVCMQNFITILHSVQEIGPFSFLFQNFELDKASTYDKCHLQSLGLDLININVYEQVYQNIPNGLKIVGIFSRNVRGQTTSQTVRHNCSMTDKSEFGPRQSLDQWQMALDNPLGYISSISMRMQNFISLFHSVQAVGPFSLFQNLELGKASTDDKCHFSISWARSCQYQCVCKMQKFIKIFQTV